MRAAEYARVAVPDEEPGYLAGIVAAMTSQSNTVSTVGGIKIPSVDNWIAGFQQGVKDTNPEVKVLNAYSQDFVDQAKCKEIALDQISQGSDVVFQVAGHCGLGAIDAACEGGKLRDRRRRRSVGPGRLRDLERPEAAPVVRLQRHPVVHRRRVRGRHEPVLRRRRSAGCGAAHTVHGRRPAGGSGRGRRGLEKLKSGEIDPPATLE